MHPEQKSSVANRPRRNTSDSRPVELPILVPGSPNYTYIPGQSVWQRTRDGERVQVLDWCPVVTRHLATHNTRGRWSGGY